LNVRLIAIGEVYFQKEPEIDSFNKSKLIVGQTTMSNDDTSICIYNGKVILKHISHAAYYLHKL